MKKFTRIAHLNYKYLMVAGALASLAMGSPTFAKAKKKVVEKDPAAPFDFQPAQVTTKPKTKSAGAALTTAKPQAEAKTDPTQYNSFVSEHGRPPGYGPKESGGQSFFPGTIGQPPDDKKSPSDMLKWGKVLMDQFQNYKNGAFGYTGQGSPPVVDYDEFNIVNPDLPIYKYTRKDMEGPFCQDISSQYSGDQLHGHNCDNRSMEDRYICMICNIYFEGRGEPDPGQVAIGQTVMTRLFNDGFPLSAGSSSAARARAATTCSIVYDKAPGSKYAQFSWTVDGGDHVMRNTRNGIGGQGKLDQIIKNAQEAFCSPPGTWTNYWNPRAANPDWGPKCQNHSKVDPASQHIFCEMKGFQVATRTREDLLENEKRILLTLPPAPTRTPAGAAQ